MWLAGVGCRRASGPFGIVHHECDLHAVRNVELREVGRGVGRDSGDTDVPASGDLTGLFALSG